MSQSDFQSQLESITPQSALATVQRVCHAAQGTRADHAILDRCIDVLGTAIASAQPIPGSEIATDTIEEIAAQ